MQYAIFLRGVNVGGANKVGMPDLGLCLSSAGLRDVKTYLQSGNVTGVSDLPAGELQELVEAALSLRFGYEAHVVIHMIAEVGRIVGNWPWGDRTDATHRYAILSSDRSVLESMAAGGGALPGGDERLQLGQLALYWEVPRGLTLATALSKHFAKRRIALATTMRNLNTLERMIQ